MSATTKHKLVVENIKLMKALEKAREYIESDARNQKYPSAIEVLAVIDDAFRPDYADDEETP